MTDQIESSRTSSPGVPPQNGFGTACGQKTWRSEIYATRYPDCHNINTERTGRCWLRSTSCSATVAVSRDREGPSTRLPES